MTQLGQITEGLGHMTGDMFLMLGGNIGVDICWGDDWRERDRERETEWAPNP